MSTSGTNAAAFAAQCCGIHHSATFPGLHFSSQCCGIRWPMLRHWSYCQFLIFFQCCGIRYRMLQHSCSFPPLSLFASFLHSFASNAQVITYNIKYHIIVSKMIKILTKSLSIGVLKHINFTHINSPTLRFC